MSQHADRTKHEAFMDASYAVRLHFLHCRFYRRLRWLLSVVSLCAGSAAITAAIQAVPAGVTIAAVIVALITVVDATADLAGKAAAHAQWRRQFQAALADADSQSLEQFDRVLKHIKSASDYELESLRMPAFNDNCRTQGHEDWVRPETFSERFMRALA